MRDLFEQWVEAWSERIRSPVLGSLAIAFVVSNWKPLFFLLFAEAPVWLRIRYFEHHTDSNSLVWYPLAVGVIAALLIPWISFGGAWVAKRPKFLLHRLQQDEGTRREIEKLRIERERETARAEFEEERAKREAAEAKRAADREAEIIAEGRRMKEAEEVGEETKEDLKTERQARQKSGQETSVMQQRTALPVQLAGHDISSQMSRAIVMTLGTSDSMMEKKDIIEGVIDEIAPLEMFSSVTKWRARVEFDAAFSELYSSNIIESVDLSGGRKEYGLSQKGYKAFDAIATPEP
jgi:hypothetical protein